jgi:hypothetical protein
MKTEFVLNGIPTCRWFFDGGHLVFIVSGEGWGNSMSILCGDKRVVILKLKWMRTKNGDEVRVKLEDNNELAILA